MKQLVSDDLYLSPVSQLSRLFVFLLSLALVFLGHTQNEPQNELEDSSEELSSENFEADIYEEFQEQSDDPKQLEKMLRRLYPDENISIYIIRSDKPKERNLPEDLPERDDSPVSNQSRELSSVPEGLSSPAAPSSVIYREKPLKSHSSPFKPYSSAPPTLPHHTLYSPSSPVRSSMEMPDDSDGPIVGIPEYDRNDKRQFLSALVTERAMFQDPTLYFLMEAAIERPENFSAFKRRFKMDHLVEEGLELLRPFAGEISGEVGGKRLSADLGLIIDVEEAVRLVLRDNDKAYQEYIKTYNIGPKIRELSKKWAPIETYCIDNPDQCPIKIDKYLSELAEYSQNDASHPIPLGESYEDLRNRHVLEGILAEQMSDSEADEKNFDEIKEDVGEIQGDIGEIKEGVDQANANIIQGTEILIKIGKDVEKKFKQTPEQIILGITKNDAFYHNQDPQLLKFKTQKENYNKTIEEAVSGLKNPGIDPRKRAWFEKQQLQAHQALNRLDKAQKSYLVQKELQAVADWTRAATSAARLVPGMPPEVIQLGVAAEESVNIGKSVLAMVMAGAIDPTGVMAIVTAAGALQKVFSDQPSFEQVIQDQLTQLREGQAKMLDKLQTVEIKIDSVMNKLDDLADLLRLNHNELIARFDRLETILGDIQEDIKQSRLIHSAEIREAAGFLSYNPIRRTATSLYSPIQNNPRGALNKKIISCLGDFYSCPKPDAYERVKEIRDHLNEMGNVFKNELHVYPFFPKKKRIFDRIPASQMRILLELPVEDSVDMLPSMMKWLKKHYKIASSDYDEMLGGRPELPKDSDLQLRRHPVFADELLYEYVNLALIRPKEGSEFKDAYMDQMCKNSYLTHRTAQMMRDHIEAAWLTYLYYSHKIAEKLQMALTYGYKEGTEEYAGTKTHFSFLFDAPHTQEEDNELITWREMEKEIADTTLDDLNYTVHEERITSRYERKGNRREERDFRRAYKKEFFAEGRDVGEIYTTDECLLDKVDLEIDEHIELYNKIIGYMQERDEEWKRERASSLSAETPPQRCEISYKGRNITFRTSSAYQNHFLVYYNMCPVYEHKTGEISICRDFKLNSSRPFFFYFDVNRGSKADVEDVMDRTSHILAYIDKAGDDRWTIFDNIESKITWPQDPRHSKWKKKYRPVCDSDGCDIPMRSKEKKFSIGANYNRYRMVERSFWRRDSYIDKDEYQYIIGKCREWVCFRYKRVAVDLDRYLKNEEQFKLKERRDRIEREIIYLRDNLSEDLNHLFRAKAALQIMAGAGYGERLKQDLKLQALRLFIHRLPDLPSGDEFRAALASVKYKDPDSLGIKMIGKMLARLPQMPQILVNTHSQTVKSRYNWRLYSDDSDDAEDYEEAYSDAEGRLKKALDNMTKNMTDRNGVKLADYRQYTHKLIPYSYGNSNVPLTMMSEGGKRVISESVLSKDKKFIIMPLPIPDEYKYSEDPYLGFGSPALRWQALQLASRYEDLRPSEKCPLFAKKEENSE